MHICGGTIHIPLNEDVVITSPSFPFSYGQGLDCVWEVRAAPGQYVEVDVVNVNLDKTIMWNDVENVRNLFSLEIVVLFVFVHTSLG